MNHPSRPGYPGFAVGADADRFAEGDDVRRYRTLPVRAEG
jgi:hypothetical protein